MHVVFGLRSAAESWPASTVCIGVFDGVHLGHQRVIAEAISNAKQTERPCVVLTFDRHPAAFLRPDQCPPIILPLGQKLRRLEAIGVDTAVVVPFDAELASQSPEQFLQSCLVEKIHAKAVVVGHDFRFGKDRMGSGEWLATRIETIIVGPHEIDGVRVSSSQIRKAISVGDVAAARKLLGEDFSLAGIVVPGNKFGRTIGIPTANLALLETQAIPALGIYAGWASTDAGRFPAAISVGNRPTIEGAGFAIEAHLIGFSGEELYGRDLLLSLTERLRDEERFESVNDMAAQMREDVRAVESLVAN